MTASTATTGNANAKTAPWNVSLLTLFPDMFPGPLGLSLAGRALARDLWRMELCNIRAFAADKHKSVDGRPAGGGPGMVLRADVIDAALRSVERHKRPILYLSPRGTPFTQSLAKKLAAGPGVILLCGRYEGVDERVLETWEARGLEELSVGDYVLSGGEPAAFVVLDCCIRLLPGVVGHDDAVAQESHTGGLLEHPHYTAPRLWQRRAVPKVLLGGDHARIAQWRKDRAEEITLRRRPDMWQAYLRRCRTTPTTPKTATEPGHGRPRSL